MGDLTIRRHYVDLNRRAAAESTAVHIGASAGKQRLLPSGESTVSRGQIRISPHEIFSPILYKRK